MRKFICFALLAMLTSCTTNSSVLVEAENFQNRGGWLVDHQAFNIIGSSYLLAHGLGEAVEDASTDVEFSEGGDYHVYVNTYNWTSPWYDKEGPGAFQVKVNDTLLPEVLGTKGDSWGWQYAGEVSVAEGISKLTLTDLTGFEGRVDAIYFTKSKGDVPPTEIAALTSLRKQKLGIADASVEENADLVIVGGGVSGCAAALTAARYGLDVVLIDNLPGLGGNHYLGVSMCGVMNKNKYPQVGNMVRQLSGMEIPTAENYADEKYSLEKSGNGNGTFLLKKTGAGLAEHRKQLLEDAGVRVYQSIEVYDAETNEGKICSVKGRNLLSAEEFVFPGTYFVDCTGDGVVGYLAGADFHYGREDRAFANEPSAPMVADSAMMGVTLLWRSAKEAEQVSFPSLDKLPWAMQCSDDYHVDGFTNRWFWETGLSRNSDTEIELIRDNMMRAIYGNWSYLKNNKAEVYGQYRLNHIGHIGMKRESRRLMGDVVLNENDIHSQREFPDASFTTTWTVDLHYADKENAKRFPGWEWITCCPNQDKTSWIDPYSVPYRVLYSRNVDNLFIGGRNMSVTHAALGTVRVMGTLGMASEVIGMAAKICVDNQTSPRGVYEDHLDALKELMTQGAPIVDAK